MGLIKSIKTSKDKQIFPDVVAGGRWCHSTCFSAIMTDIMTVYLIILGDSPESECMFHIKAPESTSIEDLKELVHARRQHLLERKDITNCTL